MNSFTPNEQRSFRRRKFVKDHAFEWAVELAFSVAFILLVLWMCEAKSFTIGIISTIIYNFAKVLYQIRWFEKDYLDRKIK